MSLSISVMRVTKACVVCNSFTHTCVIDPMPFADGQFSSPIEGSAGHHDTQQRRFSRFFSHRQAIKGEIRALADPHLDPYVT